MNKTMDANQFKIDYIFSHSYKVIICTILVVMSAFRAKSGLFNCFCVGELAGEFCHPHKQYLWALDFITCCLVDTGASVDVIEF